LIVVADLGAPLRWVGLVDGPPPSADVIVAPDALMAQVVEFLRVKHDGRVGPMLSDVAEVQIAVLNWYPSNTMAAETRSPERLRSTFTQGGNRALQ
jgi:hypothetical protein